MPSMLFDHGRFAVVTRAELLRRGVDDGSIRGLVRAGELWRCRHGVFLTAPPPSHPVDRWHQRCALALAAAGPDAALGGETAANLWDFDGFDQFAFTGGRCPEPPITVHVPLASGHRSPGVRRSPLLEPTEHRRGLPVTGAAQTLLDLGYQLGAQRVRARCGRLGATLSPHDRVELATESALRQHRVTEDGLVELVATTPPRRGGRAVLEVVLRRRPHGAPVTESYLETRGVQVLRSAGLPTGSRQVDIYCRGAFVARVDLQLTDRVIIEFDGRATHDVNDETFARDRRRWTKLTELGYLVAVFTYDDVEFRPEAVAGQVRALLVRA